MKVNKRTLFSHFQLGNAHCVLCDARCHGNTPLCDACRQDLITGFRACARCALPLHASQDDLMCGQCQSIAPKYRKTYSFALYTPPLDRMIQQLKYQQKLHYARLLGNLMAKDIIKRQLDIPDLLMPVPLHPQRLRERGYNQALELARPVAKILGVVLDIRSCRRNKFTQEQTGLQAKQRRSNVDGAFQVTGAIEGKRIAIVDDVMTTGSTVNELAKQLMKSGATSVDVWVCGRAVN